MSWWIAGASAAVSLTGSLMAESDQNDQMAQKAGDFGRRRAGIKDFQTAQKGNLTSSLNAIADNAELAALNIDRGQAVAEADARVNAAVAGVGGTSTDQIISETNVNAELAKTNVKRDTEAKVDQAKQDFVDRNLNAENQIGSLDTSTKDQTATHALSFASGFLGGL